MIYLNPMDIQKGKETTVEETTVEETPKEKYTVKELRAMCKERGLTGYSKLKEAELIALLEL